MLFAPSVFDLIKDDVTSTCLYRREHGSRRDDLHVRIQRCQRRRKAGLDVLQARIGRRKVLEKESAPNFYYHPISFISFSSVENPANANLLMKGKPIQMLFYSSWMIFQDWINNVLIDSKISYDTLGPKSSIYSKIHILKISFFTKIHIFKISIFTKFTLSKSQFFT